MSVRKDLYAPIQPAFTIDYIDENGTRKRERFHGTKSQATQRYGLILNRVKAVNHNQKLKSHDMTLFQLVNEYIKNSAVDGKSDLTVRRIKNSTDPLIRIIGGNTKIRELNGQLIEQYKAMRLEEKTPRKMKLSKAGLNSELKHIKAMFNWAVKFDIIESSPMKATTFLKVLSKPIRFLKTPELKALFKVLSDNKDTDHFELITFYLTTGARRSEIIPPKFTWDNVNFSQKLIILTGKRGKRRTISLDQGGYDLLSKRKSKGYEYPFPFSPDQVSGILKRVYGLAGIKNANVHTLRKTCGALLIQQKVDIYRVSKLLGHSSVTVTEKHYVDLLKSEYSELMETINCQIDGYLISENKLPYYCHFPDQTRPNDAFEHV